MLVDHLAWTARLLVAAVFAVAAYGKLRARMATWRAVREFGVPAPFVPTAARALVLSEAAVAVAVLVPASAAWAAGAGLVLLAVFTAAIGVQLAQGRHPACSCFGTASAAPIGPGTLLRNAALLALTGGALAGALARPSPPAGLPAAASVGLAVAVALGTAGVLRVLAVRSRRLSSLQR
ncbi:MauE/DoxX family redox-associated membrane protein [Streptomyces sp. NBC_01304]|uniref:MauE/DoxX family redox-associated membrane protein n=1 Tax=Streptomyces sp. NBC_01304 TaxID=2903818 RepID=UPI002E156EDD|nr:hypothetical protein OG430_24430 [Streptomyces sp. NBC_01304]